MKYNATATAVIVFAWPDGNELNAYPLWKRVKPYSPSSKSILGRYLPNTNFNKSARSPETATDKKRNKAWWA